LSLPQTGEAVIIDIGEANDIHPKNKYDVGYRLGLAALKVAYQKDVIHSGPVFQSMSVIENKIEIKFTQLGSGLVAKGDKYGYLKGFFIAGNDHHFVWAQAYIKGNSVIVFSDGIEQPVAVRYAWSDNPDDANLCNKEGLPASPFRTDNWKEAQELPK
jgi:sialate O-acetylesterase